MSAETAQTGKKSSSFSTDAEISSLVVIAGLTAVLFAGGLALAEGVPEFGVDIDLKPFFIVYTVILFVPWGTPTIATAVGATIAEGLLDIIEGYEPDEPFGWAGYIVAFTFLGWYWKDVDLDNKTKLFVGSI
ncbi:MAG: hypothetical protein SV760_08750, partial [Halobacteria archaeon]|nr:hypothetical protein [Halobacteria archaeon]